jgi:hypothetical protein
MAMCDMLSAQTGGERHEITDAHLLRALREYAD